MTSFNPFSESKSGTTNRGTNATAFPKGARLNTREAAEALLAAGPSHLLKPVGTPMADALMAAGEQALAMNPIRLASPAQARANQHAIYGARAGVSELPAVEVVQPQGVYPQGVSGATGEPVEMWVNPPDSRRIPFGRDPIPVPSPRSQKDQSRLPPLKHQSRLAPTKDQSRLEPPSGTPRHPSRNPNRVPSETFGMTIAPKGDRARMATHEEANQAAPWDTAGDILSKAWQNSGDDLEGVMDYAVPYIRRKFGDEIGDVVEYGAGYLQTGTPGQQKREALVDDMRKHNARRYENWRRAITENPLSTFLDLNVPNVLGFRAWPTVSGLIEQSRKRERGKASSE